MVKHGEVWDVDFDQHPDSRQNGIRPAVVVQTDLLNVHDRYALTIVAPMSGTGSERIPSHALILPTTENGLSKDSFVKCEQIQTVPRTHMLSRRGSLSTEDIVTVNAKLKNALDLNNP